MRLRGGKSLLGICILFALTLTSCYGVMSGKNPGPARNPAGTPRITTADLPLASVQKAYAAQLTAASGTAPYTWSISAGSLPAGLTVDHSGGVVSGTPTTPGYGSFSIQVNDADNKTASASYSILVTPPLDQYGGMPSRSCAINTGFWHTEKLSGRWWLCDPAGNTFFMQNVAGMFPPSNGCDNSTGQCNSYETVVKQKYGDEDVNWGPQQNRRIQSWGFNSIGQFSTGWVQPTQTDSRWVTPNNPTGAQPVKMPMVSTMLVSNYAAINVGNYASQAMKDLLFGFNSNYNGWRASIMDFYDPNFGQWLNGYFGQSGPGPNDSPWMPIVFLDDTDWFWGMGAGPDFHTTPPGHTNSDVGYMVMITSPMQTFNPNPAQRGTAELYTDTKVYSKTAMTSPAANCSIQTPCSLRDYLYKKYGGNIASLNTAWGSNYTAFDSAGTQVSGETVGTGDGQTTVFTHSLAQTPVSPLSVLVKVNGRAQGGDCPWWNSGCNRGAANTGSISGPSGTTIAGSASNLNYSNGQLQITFTTAPPSGEAITADYVANGWMYGSGLMDEDGRHSGWLGTNPICLQAATVCDGQDYPSANANANVAADLDSWIAQFAGQYFGTCRTYFKKYSPNTLYFGADNIGTWGVPARKEILQGAAPFIDGIFPASSPQQQYVDYTQQYLGDKPMVGAFFGAATPDSSLFRYATTIELTQQQRGIDYMNWMQTMLSMTATPTASQPYVGGSWWGLIDFWNEKTDWGLISLSDNPYDGKSAVISPGIDEWGFATGGEQRNYGDVIDSVKRANTLWYPK